MATSSVQCEEDATNTNTVDRQIASSLPSGLVNEVVVHVIPSKVVMETAKADPYLCEALPRDVDHGPQDSAVFQEDSNTNAETVPGLQRPICQINPDPENEAHSKQGTLLSESLPSLINTNFSNTFLTGSSDLFMYEDKPFSLFLWEEVAIKETLQANEMSSDLVVERGHIVADTIPGFDNRQWHAGEEKMELSQMLRPFVSIREIKQTKELDNIKSKEMQCQSTCVPQCSTDLITKKDLLDKHWTFLNPQLRETSSPQRILTDPVPMESLIIPSHDQLVTVPPSFQEMVVTPEYSSPNYPLTFASNMQML